MTDNKRITLLRAIFIILVLLQVAVAIMFAQNDTYASQFLKYATVVYEGGSISLAAPFMSVIGFLCRLLKMHPLVFAHIIMPVIMIPLAYYSYYFLLKRVFKSSEVLKYVALLFICLLNMYGYCLDHLRGYLF